MSYSNSTCHDAMYAHLRPIIQATTFMHALYTLDLEWGLGMRLGPVADSIIYTP